MKFDKNQSTDVPFAQFLSGDAEPKTAVGQQFKRALVAIDTVADGHAASDDCRVIPIANKPLLGYLKDQYIQFSKWASTLPGPEDGLPAELEPGAFVVGIIESMIRCDMAIGTDQAILIVAPTEGYEDMRGAFASLGLVLEGDGTDGLETGLTHFINVAKMVEGLKRATKGKPGAFAKALQLLNPRTEEGKSWLLLSLLRGHIASVKDMEREDPLTDPAHYPDLGNLVRYATRHDAGTQGASPGTL